MESASSTISASTESARRGECASGSTASSSSSGASDGEADSTGDSRSSTSSSSSESAEASDDAQPPQHTFDLTGRSTRSIDVVVLEPDHETGAVPDQTVDRESIESAVRAALPVLGISTGDVVIQLLDDDSMTLLHRQFCDIDSTTDVLTFDRTDDESGEDTMFIPESNTLAAEANLLRRAAIHVDLAICIDEAARQATSHGHSITREIILYAIHGILHCLGHDDHDPEAYERMHAIEDDILVQIGVGKTFNLKSGHQCADSG